MQKFLDDVTTLYWWLAVVLVGVAINIASAYLKPRMDLWLASWSAGYRERSELQRRRHVAYVNRLRGDAQEQLLAGTRELRHRLRFLSFLMISALIFLIALQIKAMPPRVLTWPFTFDPNILIRIVDAFTMLLGALAFLQGFRELRAAVDEVAAVGEARDGSEHSDGSP